MTDVQVTIETLNFPCVPWAVSGTEKIQPVPGTWTLAPESLCNHGIKGIVCCPKRTCGESALIPWDMGETDNGALKLPSLCCRKCGFFCHARLQEWDTRKLYCVAYELIGIRDNKPIATGRKEYLHAQSREQAISFFIAGTGHFLDRLAQQWRLIDAAIALGFFGQESDKDQNNLSAD